MSEIVKTQSTELQYFGGRENVKELSERLQLMVPGGRRMQPHEALALAQVAIAHGLDPFNGEVWYIPGSGVLVGIKGLRKLSKKQSNFWTEFERVTRPGDYNCPDDAIVYLCYLRDDLTMESWANNIKKFKSLGFNLEEAQGFAGAAPVTVGVGIWLADDKTKMKPVQAAMFRAEKDALKRRFDVPFDLEVAALSDEPINGDYDLEAEWTDLDQDEPREPQEIISELGYETPPEPPEKEDIPPQGRFWPGDLIERIMGELPNLYNHEKHVVNALNLSPFVDDIKPDYNEVVEWMRARKEE